MCGTHAPETRNQRHRSQAPTRVQPARPQAHLLPRHRRSADPHFRTVSKSYYESVVAKEKEPGIERKRSSARFSLPGLYHCSGGPGPIAFRHRGARTALTAVSFADAIPPRAPERWVEETAPLPRGSSRRNTSTAIRRKPWRCNGHSCPYPAGQRREKAPATHERRGDLFVCTVPK